MRFLILTQYFPPEIGGAQTRLKSFAGELLHSGHEVEIVTAMPNYPRGRFFEGYEKGFYRQEVLDGLTVHRLWIYPAIGGGLKRMLNYLSFTMACVYGLVRCKKPDYLFVESPPLFLSIPAFLACLFWRSPFIFNVADLWPDVIADGGFIKDGFILRSLRALERWSYRRAAYVNSVTDWITKELREKKSVPETKLLFLPNGVDISQFQPRPPDERLKNRLGLAGKRVVLWAGTLGYAHGLEHVLNAAKLLEKETDIHFFFLGDGSARQDLVALKERLGLSNVTVHDPVPLEQVSSFYSIALCGLASLLDTQTYRGARPSKVFPVLASAKPLIFVGAGEPADLVRQAKAGIVVPPGDSRSIADAVLQLASDQELASTYGENGRRFVEQNLQWSHLVAEWLHNLRRGPARNAAPAGVSLTA